MHLTSSTALLSRVTFATECPVAGFISLLVLSSLKLRSCFSEVPRETKKEKKSVSGDFRLATICYTQKDSPACLEVVEFFPFANPV